MSKLKGEQDEIKDKEPTNNRNEIPRSNFGSNLNNVLSLHKSKVRNNNMVEKLNE
jgi:hypothetical protein